MARATSPPPVTATTTKPAGGAKNGRRRGPSKGDMKEDVILETTWQLLAVKPLSTITIDEIAQGAGISRPTFYFYFDSRDAVARALASRVADQWIDAMAGSFDVTAEPVDAVRALAETFVGLWRTEGPVLRAMAVLYENDLEMRGFWDNITETLLVAAADSIERERVEGRALAGPPGSRDLARVLAAMLWRTGYETSLTPPSADFDRRMIDSLTTVMLRAVYGTTNPSALQRA